MTCPNCKAVGSLRLVLPRGYVECVTDQCHWNQTPLPELVCDAAVYTWHRQNPSAPSEIEAAMSRVSYSLYWDDCSSVAGWMIFRVGFSGRSLADPRIWPKSERAAAEAALAEFVRRQEAA